MVYSFSVPPRTTAYDPGVHRYDLVDRADLGWTPTAVPRSPVLGHQCPGPPPTGAGTQACCPMTCSARERDVEGSIERDPDIDGIRAGTRRLLRAPRVFAQT
jgi:hypothetical protein